MTLPTISPCRKFTVSRTRKPRRRGDPERIDATLARVLAILAERGDLPGDLEVQLAREGVSPIARVLMARGLEGVR